MPTIAAGRQTVNVNEKGGPSCYTTAVRRVCLGAGLASLAACVVQSPIPEPESDVFLELKQLLAIFQQAVWKQEEHGEELKRYQERTANFVESNRALLLEAARAGKADERPLAIAGLGFAKGGWSRDLLSRLVQEPDPVIRESAIQAIALLHIRLGKAPDAPTVERIRAAIDSTYARETVQALFFFSTDPQYGEDEAFLRRIEAKLEHPDREVRVQAARTLTIYRKAASAPALHRGLEDAEPMVRINAAAGLAAIQGGAALPRILPLLRDSDPDVIAFAAGLVAQLAPRGIAYRCPSDGAESEEAVPCPVCGVARIPVPRK